MPGHEFQAIIFTALHNITTPVLLLKFRKKKLLKLSDWHEDNTCVVIQENANCENLILTSS